VKKLRERGFTLFEALLVITLISIIASVTLPRFLDSLTLTKMHSFSSQAQHVIKQAQQFSLAYNVPVSLTYTQYPTGNVWVIDKLNADLSVDRNLLSQDFILSNAIATSNIEFTKIVFQPKGEVKVFKNEDLIEFSDNISLKLINLETSQGVTINIYKNSGSTNFDNE